jgi:prepilin peptidase CpaA
MSVSNREIAEKNVGAIQKGRSLAWAVSFASPLVLIFAFSWCRLNVGQVNLTAAGTITVLLIGVASFCDVCWLKIPNWLTYPGVFWGLCINLVGEGMTEEARRSLGYVGLLESAAGLIVPFVLMFVLFSITGGGAGDVKLTAALGALLGLNVVVNAILISFVLAGAIAVVNAICDMGVKGFFEFVFRWIGSFLLPLWIRRPSKESSEMLRRPMPLAPSFAVGTIIAMLDSNGLNTWLA